MRFFCSFVCFLKIKIKIRKFKKKRSSKKLPNASARSLEAFVVRIGCDVIVFLIKQPPVVLFDEDSFDDDVIVVVVNFVGADFGCVAGVLFGRLVINVFVFELKDDFNFVGNIEGIFVFIQRLGEGVVLADLVGREINL